MSAQVRSSARPATLPPILTPILGREADLDRLLGLIDDPETRLVTITGPGGVGKTRLAVHLATTLFDEFGRDVVFVPLAAIRDPELVVPSIGQALEVPFESNDTYERQLVETLCARSPVLVLDNFEQVLGAAPDVARLLARCPGVAAVVTSRAALDVDGEQRYLLSPLPTPPPAVASHGEIVRSSAVALFVARAQAVNPALVIDDRAAVTIAEICRRLDGLPLAIELAAARTSILSPAALLARLSNRFQLLRTDRPGVSDRLSTMRNAIDWSYGLLTAPEQALFRRLSVFPGGCGLDAVEAVFLDANDGRDAVDVLAALVAHSLVQVVAQSLEEPRYAMLETLREYGLDQLALQNELDAARMAHAAYVVGFSETAEPNLVGPGQGAWLDRLEREWTNIRAACTWANDAGHPDIPLRVFGAAWRFCLIRGHATECRPLLDRALADTTADETARRSRALVAAGTFAEEQRDLDVAEALLGQAHDLAARIGQQTDQVRALIGLAHVAQDRGDLAAALDASTRAVTIATAVGDQRNLASALGSMGNIHYFQGNLDETSRYWDEARQLVVALGDQQAESVLVGNLGAVASARGEFGDAVVLQERALALARQFGDVPAMAYALINLAEQVRHLGDYGRATACLAEGIPILHDLGYKGTEGQGLHIHASLALAQGDLPHAAGLLLASNDLFVEAGDQFGITENADLLAEICIGNGAAGTAVELLAAAGAARTALGAEVKPFKERDLARISARAQARLSAHAWWRHDEAGRALDLNALAGKIAVVARDIAGTPGPAAVPLQPEPMATLTNREREVLRLLALGRSTREIADTLYISPRTATTHITNIFGKLEVTSRAAAVAYALRSGLA